MDSTNNTSAQAVSDGLELHLLLEVAVALERSTQTDLHQGHTLVAVMSMYRGLVVTFVGGDDVGLAVHFHGLNGIGMAEGHEASVPRSCTQNAGSTLFETVSLS